MIHNKGVFIMNGDKIYTNINIWNDKHNYYKNVFYISRLWFDMYYRYFIIKKV